MKLINEGTTAEQFEQVDLLLQRFSRRLHKTITGVITPFPIYSYVYAPTDDAVLRYMFPAVGMITTCLVFIETMPKSGITVVANIENDIGKVGKEYFVKRNRTMLEPNVDVYSSDRLSIYVDKLVQEESLLGVWISLLFVPNIKDAYLKQCLIEELDKQEIANAS